MPSLANVLTAWKMPALESGHTLSVWIYIIFVTSLQLCGGSASSNPSITTATTADALPPPVLSVSSRSRDHVTLVCRAPQGHQGVLFVLYGGREQVESSAAPQGSGEAAFSLSAEMVAAAAADSQQQYLLYCCLYKNTMGLYSAFSPYLRLEQPPQPPPGAAPTASPVANLLPRPTLTLQQQPGSWGVWHLSCRGSVAYPGSLFSLYRADSKQTVAIHQAPRNGHHTAFPIPVQDQETARYECRYSTLLGKHWSDSERSLPLEVARGISPTAAAGAGLSLSGVDWPLLAGSFSAVVLFMAVVVLVVFVVQRKVRGAAAEKKKRFGISTFDF